MKAIALKLWNEPAAIFGLAAGVAVYLATNDLLAALVPVASGVGTRFLVRPTAKER